jgi:glycosyltransferase involved in cell wall biosynthesis
MPHPLRILHINSARTWRGGEQQTLWLCQGLQQRGHKSFLACQPGSDLHKRANAAGIEVCAVTMRGEWDVWAVRNLVGAIRRNSIGVVHFHTAHAHTLGLLAAQLAKAPVRVLTRRVDFHIHKHLLNRWKYGPGLTAIVAISEGIRGVLIGDGLSPERVTTVHSGVNLQRIANVGDGSYLRDEFGISENTLTIGIVGALAPHKHHQNFLEAAAIVKKATPAVRFLIVGDGELREALERSAASRDLSADVIFTGFREDVLEITRGLDIFVLCSYLEGLGTAILDAMALGRPIVATQVGGIPEIVLQGKNGLLVPPRDPQKLAEAILKLANDPILRDRMGAFGREHAKNFTVEKVIQRTEEIYFRALDRLNRRNAHRRTNPGAVG